MSTAHFSLDQPVPFLRYEEKDLVLLDGAPNGASEVVPPNRILLGCGIEKLKNGVLGIQTVVAAEEIVASVKIVGPRLGTILDSPPPTSAQLEPLTVPHN